MENLLVLNEWTENVFCPTGPGGGIDPTCSRGGRKSVSFESLGATWRDSKKTEAAKEEFRKLSDDDLITVYHGTTPERAESLVKSGEVRTPEGYTSDLPTLGVTDLYVAPTYADADKYGPSVISFQVRKGDLRRSVESEKYDKGGDLAESFFKSFDGAVLPGGYKIDAKIEEPKE